MKANLEWIEQQWLIWLRSDRAKKLEQHPEHIAKLFAAHCIETLYQVTERSLQ